MSEWPKGAVLAYTGERFIVLDGSQSTDFTDCAEYVPASELERATGERDMERAAHGRASDLAGYLEDRRAEAEAKLAEVRAEVEKAEANAQLGNGGELEDPLANIKAILDSSPSLSGGGEVESVPCGCDINDGIVTDEGFCTGCGAQVIRPVPGTTNNSLSGDAEELLLEEREAERKAQDATVHALRQIHDEASHHLSHFATDTPLGGFAEDVRRLAEEGLNGAGTSGDVEERGEEEWRLILNPYEVTDLICGELPFERLVDLVATAAGEMISTERPEPTELVLRQQSSTTGNSPEQADDLLAIHAASMDVHDLDGVGMGALAELLLALRGRGWELIQTSTGNSLSGEPGDRDAENSGGDVVDFEGRKLLAKLPSGEIATVVGYVISHDDDGSLEVMVRGGEGFDRDDLLAALATQPKDTHLSVEGSDKPTKILTEGEWEGQRVGVMSDGFCIGHRLEPVDHYGQPTEFLMCSECQGIAFKPAALHLSGDGERLGRIAENLEAVDAFKDAAFLRDLATRLSPENKGFCDQCEEPKVGTVALGPEGEEELCASCLLVRLLEVLKPADGHDFKLADQCPTCGSSVPDSPENSSGVEEAVISQLLDRDDGMLRTVVQLMAVDDRGSAEDTLRRALAPALTQPVSPQPDPTNRLSEGTGDDLRERLGSRAAAHAAAFVFADGEPTQAELFRAGLALNAALDATTQKKPQDEEER